MRKLIDNIEECKGKTVESFRTFEDADNALIILFNDNTAVLIDSVIYQCDGRPTVELITDMERYHEESAFEAGLITEEEFAVLAKEREEELEEMQRLAKENIEREEREYLSLLLARYGVPEEK